MNLANPVSTMGADTLPNLEVEMKKEMTIEQPKAPVAFPYKKRPMTSKVLSNINKSRRNVPIDL